MWSCPEAASKPRMFDAPVVRRENGTVEGSWKWNCSRGSGAEHDRRIPVLPKPCTVPSAGAAVHRLARATPIWRGIPEWDPRIHTVSVARKPLTTVRSSVLISLLAAAAGNRSFTFLKPNRPGIGNALSVHTRGLTRFVLFR